MAKKHPKQFVGTNIPRLFFDRRLRATGNTKSLSVGKVVPESWSYVRLEVVDRAEDSITLKITRLLESTPIACISKAGSGSKQNA